MAYPIQPEIHSDPALAVRVDVDVELPEIDGTGASSAPSERVASLSRILRGIGAAALIAAASTFLLQHWETGGDLQRYYALLAHT